MITFEEAIKIAKETKPNVNKYEEYKEIYVFENKDALPSDGGADMPIIVIKSTGKVMGFSNYAIRYPERLMDTAKVTEGDC